MDQLLLDAAYPPSDPTRWTDTLHLAGAQGCMAYVWDPFIPGIWTPDYCHAVQAAGFGILPVYVSFTQPIGHARAVMAAYGWSSGPVMGDIEQGSWPSEAYYQAWCQDLRDHGYMPVTYGTGSTLDSYRRYGDKAFLAAYIQRNLQPIPALAGVSYDGWQYANSFQINGVEVDASVTSIPLISGQEDDMFTDNDRSALMRVLGLLSQGQQFNVDGTPIPNAPRWQPQILEDVRRDQASQDATLAAILAKPAANVTVDNTAVLAAIQDLKDHNPDDAGLADKIDALSKHLGIGSP